MSQCWLISDTHFGHENAYRFEGAYGGRMRSWANNATDGDAMMVEAWNSVVKPTDRVYHLGDVALRRKSLCVLEQLHGRIVLIRGNHDIFKLKDYTPHFDDIRGTHKLDQFILSHYPIHPEHLPEWCPANIHGHTHDRTVNGERYHCVCVEQLKDLKPVPFEELRAKYTRGSTGV